MYFIGTDIGGTFTDVFAIEVETGRSITAKVLTDHESPTRSVSRGIEQMIGSNDLDPGSVSRVLHGTTLVTNALIQRRGVRAALLVTEGFRDALEIGTEHRFDLYDLDMSSAASEVARRIEDPTYASRTAPQVQAVSVLRDESGQTYAYVDAIQAEDGATTQIIWRLANGSWKRTN